MAHDPIVDSRIGGRFFYLSPSKRFMALVISAAPEQIGQGRGPRLDEMTPMKLGLARLLSSDATDRNIDAREGSDNCDWIAGVAPIVHSRFRSPESTIVWRPDEGAIALLSSRRFEHETASPQAVTIDLQDHNEQWINWNDRQSWNKTEHSFEATMLQWSKAKLLVEGFVRPPPSEGQVVDQPVVEYAEAPQRNWYEITKQGRLAPRSAPVIRAKDRSSEIRQISASTVARVDRDGQQHNLFSVNDDLRDITRTRIQHIQYTDGRGRQLIAALLLPYGFTAGHQYPLIVYVYGGQIVDPKELPAPVDVDQDSFLNLSLLTGHGYAVLIPSVPLSPPGVPGEPLRDLNDGIEPAVSRVIEMGSR